MEEHHIEVRKTARYYVLKPKNEAKGVVYAMHGYRQLGPYFTPQFQVLADADYIVIAPEGLHRFYIEGYSGRVGASWMTKEDRETDIVDYVRYLEDVLDANETLIADLPIHLLGFSQGGPTACRWMAATMRNLTSLILYATVFPNDFDFEAAQEWLQKLPCLIAFGDQDQFAPEKIIQEKMDWMKGKGLQPELLRFRGGHEIQDEVLRSIMTWMEKN